MRKEDRKGHRYRLIVGVDTNHNKAHNTMGFVKVGDSQRIENRKTRTLDEWWFDLDELDMLGTHLVISSRFWAKTRPKSGKLRGDVEEFTKFWLLLRDH
jgi:hypothetical protein